MRTILHLRSLVVLSLVLTCLAVDSSKSETDQYVTTTLQHDQSHPFRFFSSEALKTVKSQHRFDMNPKKALSKEDFPLDNDIVPDLQVGCGDGLLVETTTVKPVLPKHKRVHLRKERRKREASERKPRSYFSYSVYGPSVSQFRAHSYILRRPYFIPVFGTDYRRAIYFPPQPVFINPGFPLHNPPNRHYLPAPPTTTETPTTMVTLADRAGPIWGERPAESTTSRPTGFSTTRRPSRPNTSTFPPLIHNPDPNTANNRPNVQAVRPTTTTTTTTTTPPPPPIEVAEDEEINGNRISSPAANQCVFAIINCCSAGSKDISSACFERQGCPGPFWGSSPCESEFAREAIALALNYYQP